MTAEQNSDIADALKRMAQGDISGQAFTVEYVRFRGTPALWEEQIVFEQSGTQKYNLTRSFVDAGGAPIGVWESPSEETRALPIIRSLVGARVWELPSDNPVPGADASIWRYSTRDAKGELTVSRNTSVLMRISDLDMQLRRIANDLVDSGSGAAVRCRLQLTPSGVDTATLSASIANEGSRDCMVPNPFRLKGATTDFMRFEIAQPPTPQVGMTGPGIRFVPLPSAGQANLAPAWRANYIALHAGQSLTFPFEASISMSKHKGHFVRAVFSHYRDARLGSILVRGRVFSDEVEVGRSGAQPAN
jgi:hypothetical protein